MLINIKQVTFNKQSGLIDSVSARELYDFLEIKREFTNWVKPYFSESNDYGFVENVDFVKVDVRVNINNVPMLDYWLTIDMAKEVSMLSRTEKGRQARKYFIECERRLKDKTGYITLKEHNQVVKVLERLAEGHRKDAAHFRFMHEHSYQKEQELTNNLKELFTLEPTSDQFLRTARIYNKYLDTFSDFQHLLK